MNDQSEMKEDYSDALASARENGTLVRGKYFERAMRDKGLVRIDEDVLKKFPSAQELNAALRSLIEASRHIHER